MTYDKVHTSLLLFLLYKSRFVTYDLRGKKERGTIDMAIKKEGYDYQKGEIRLSKKEVHIVIPLIKP